MPHRISSCLLALLATAALQQAAPLPATPETIQQIQERLKASVRERFAVNLLDQVEVRYDLVYARYSDRELCLDLFLPKTGAGPFPGVVYVHGGGLARW